MTTNLEEPPPEPPSTPSRGLWIAVGVLAGVIVLLAGLLIGLMVGGSDNVTAVAATTPATVTAAESTTTVPAITTTPTESTTTIAPPTTTATATTTASPATTGAPPTTATPTTATTLPIWVDAMVAWGTELNTPQVLEPGWNFDLDTGDFYAPPGSPEFFNPEALAATDLHFGELITFDGYDAVLGPVQGAEMAIVDTVFECTESNPDFSTAAQIFELEEHMLACVRTNQGNYGIIIPLLELPGVRIVFVTLVAPGHVFPDFPYP